MQVLSNLDYPVSERKDVGRINILLIVSIFQDRILLIFMK